MFSFYVEAKELITECLGSLLQTCNCDCTRGPGFQRWGACSRHQPSSFHPCSIYLVNEDGNI